MEVTIKGHQGEGKTRLAEQIARMHLQGKFTNVPLVDVDDVLQIGKGARLLEYTPDTALKKLKSLAPGIIIWDIEAAHELSKARQLVNDYKLATGHNPLTIYVLPNHL